MPLIVANIVIENSSYNHDKVSIALSKLLAYYPNFVTFVLKHFEDRPPILKRIMSEENIKIAFRLLKYAPQEFKNRWNWSPLYELLNHSNEQVEFYV